MFKLVKLANDLDKKGLHKEADRVDFLIGLIKKYGMLEEEAIKLLDLNLNSSKLAMLASSDKPTHEELEELRRQKKEKKQKDREFSKKNPPSKEDVATHSKVQKLHNKFLSLKKRQAELIEKRQSRYESAIEKLESSLKEIDKQIWDLGYAISRGDRLITPDDRHRAKVDRIEREKYWSFES